jgi:predicted phosphodiesterase
MSERELREVLGDTRAAVVAFGHHHVTFTRQVGDILLVDVSAVGNPKDGDLRCKYGVFTWDEAAGAWSVEIRKLDYPLAETEAEILASGLPDPAKTLRKLKKASY